MHGKVLSQAIHMSNMKAPSQRAQKLWTMFKFCVFTKVCQRSRSPSHFFSMHGKDLSQAIHIPNMRALSQTVQKLWKCYKVLCFYKSRSKVMVKVTRSNFLVCTEAFHPLKHPSKFGSSPLMPQQGLVFTEVGQRSRLPGHKF